MELSASSCTSLLDQHSQKAVGEPPATEVPRGCASAPRNPRTQWALALGALLREK